MRPKNSCTCCNNSWRAHPPGPPMKVPKSSPSARKREPSAFRQLIAPTILRFHPGRPRAASLVPERHSLADEIDGAVESCREGAGLCLVREIDPEHDTGRRQRITERQRRKFLVIEPCPHRLDGLHEAIFIDQLDLDPEHACCPRGQTTIAPTAVQI